MAPTTDLRKKFASLAKKRGPRPGWQSQAAKELGFSPSYISNLSAGRATSPAAVAALREWKRINKVA